MIRVVVADDDPLVRETLRDYIPWRELDMEVVAVAEDGSSALSICRELRPEILFTDVRMPGLSGLDVAISLQEEEVPTKVVVVSALPDFNYVRKALSVGAVDYILKPIKLEELARTARKLRDLIAFEVDRSGSLERLRRQAADGAPLMRGKFLFDLVIGGCLGSLDMREKLSFFDVPLAPEESVAVAVAEIDDWGRFSETADIGRRQFVGSSVSSIIDTAVSNAAAGVSFVSGDNEYVVVFNQAAGFGDREAETIASIKAMLNEFGAATVSFGIGHRVATPERAPESYLSARRALTHKFYAGKDSVIRIEDVAGSRRARPEKASWTYFSAERTKRKIVSAAGLGDADKLVEALGEFFAPLSGAGEWGAERGFVIGLGLELSVAVYRELRDMADEGDLLPRYLSVSATILAAETVPAVQDAVADFALSVAAHMRRRCGGRNDEIVRRIRSFVEERISKDLSLADVADAVCLSPSYAASVFKKETGETVNDYIIRLKMEKAKRMLAETRLKVWEIAEALGYVNHHYFSYAFKRFAGMTPQQFRGESG